MRVLRRRPRGESATEPEPGRAAPEPGAEERAWREMLAAAAQELNESFRASGAPFLCAVEEDPEGITLRVSRLGEEGRTEDVEEEVLDSRELPVWLGRLRLGLGLLVDETA
ncbi:MAG: hypothetical protein SCH98_18130 [Deferrisomatales bacterium]|nr:hypothetical protein [Deferrisomatales bacterium]